MQRFPDSEEISDQTMIAADYTADLVRIHMNTSASDFEEGQVNSDDERLDETIHEKESQDENESQESTAEEEKTDNRRPRRQATAKRKDYAALHSGSGGGVKIQPSAGGSTKSQPNDKKKIKKSKEVVEKENGIAELEDKVRKAQDEIEEMKNENTLLRDKIKKMKSESELSAKYIANLKKNLLDAQRQTINTQTELKQVKEEQKRTAQNELANQQKIKDMEETISGFTQTAIKRDKRIEELERQLEENKKPEEEEEDPPKKVIILGDSNAHNTHPYLVEESTGINYEIIPAYTMEQLEQSAEKTNDKEQTIIVHTGTNDIKRGVKANEAMDKLQKVTNNLEAKGINFLVAQVPPVYYGSDTNDIRRKRVSAYNTLIADHYGDKAILTTELESDPQNIGQDKLHLSKQGSKTNAQLIHEKVEKLLKPHASKENENIKDKKPGIENQTTITIRTDKQKAARVIGKEGQRVRAIKKTHGVDIDTDHLITGERMFVIHGEKSQVTAAKDEIEEIIRQTEQTDDERKWHKVERRTNTTCRNYAKTGRCDWGNRCMFIHRRNPVDISPPHPQTRRKETPK